MISPAHPIVLAVGERTVSCLLEGSLMAAAVSVLLWLSPKGNSRTRFVIWYSTLVGIGALLLIAQTASGTSIVGFMPHITLPVSWATYGLTAWAAVSFLGLVRIFRGLRNVHSLRQRCRELNPNDLPEGAWQGLEDLVATRRVQFCVADEVKGPTAVGFVRPAVLLPTWALTDLSAGELNRVLLHELAHLQRWDDWTNLLQKMLRVLLWFHPAVWWIDSRLSLERESACDDLVLAKAPDARAYAECLVSLAEKSSLRRGVALAVAAVGRMRQTTVRLGRILDRGRARETGLSKLALASTGTLGLIVLLAFAHLPNLVQFHNGSRVEVATVWGHAAAEPDLRAPVRLSGTPRLQGNPVVIPAAMQIPVNHEPYHPITKRTKLVRTAHKQHSISPILVRASLIGSEQQLAARPMLVVFFESSELYAGADETRSVAQPWSGPIPENDSGDQDAFRNGAVRVFRLTVFAEGVRVRQEIISNVI
ncbi:MAG TPA: M56 family metallopeptidase [Terriglobales bacterium]|nr:M56 family metallopeptidase [Terriglobales bacterium]